MPKRTEARDIPQAPGLDASSRDLVLPLDFIKELSATQAIEGVPAVVARWFHQMFRADRASIALADGHGGLTVIAIEGNAAIPLGMEFPIEGTMVGRVYSRKITEYDNDLTASSDADCQMLAKGGVLSCLDTPIFSGDACYGTINVGRVTTGTFTDNDARKLEAMAHLIAALMHIHHQTGQLRRLADRDPLTDAMNRRAFRRDFDVIRQNRRRVGGVGVALLDLDHFKAVNDNFGHDVGDQVLVLVSSLIRAAFRTSDLVSRFGGEEFCVAVDGISSHGFMVLLKRLTQTLRSTPVLTKRGPLKVTASVGAIYSEHFRFEFQDIYSRMDEALYRAKRGGRDRVEMDIVT